MPYSGVLSDKIYHTYIVNANINNLFYKWTHKLIYIIYSLHNWFNLQM